MPLTPDMRRSIDQIRDYLYGGGYPDPSPMPSNSRSCSSSIWSKVSTPKTS